ncbi:globin [Pseudodonghicola flavimaris]|uniref:Globin n=1 Tax=Pseudodonghicola flavimaris TaxID=3050036 RepID=A0ABT7EWE4_9RHOB|nr:globin [Pseudodonghicola flavimaris]MDK3016667.1 globin [Pseudodonghicola flavimaris]
MRSTLPQVFAEKAAIAEAFFTEAFASDPEMERFFPHSRGPRKELFVTLLTKVAQCAECPANLEAVAQQVWAEQRPLGITPQQYRAGGRAMSKAIEATLSDRLDQEDLQSWAEVIAAFTGRLAVLTEAAA